MSPTLPTPTLYLPDLDDLAEALKTLSDLFGKAAAQEILRQVIEWMKNRKKPPRKSQGASKKKGRKA